MMELTCVVVLILAGAVTATPHGYGVKGGAFSRADAGAFGGSGIPVPVPLGASYSGSFSKSSASSFSSSSASSSASSSSFSYNGSGAGHTGFGNNGAAAIGTGGCGSGSCQSGGAQGISANHGASNAGASLQAYNSANAVATAGAAAGVVSGPGCQGSNCNDYSTECASGKCKPNISPESTNKCLSGQCVSGEGHNDIFVNTDTTKSTHDSKEQTSNYGKMEADAVSDCSTGNCGSSAATKPHAHDTIKSYGSSSSDNNRHSATSDSDIFTGYRKPALHLETPKFESSCTYGNCGSGPAATGTGDLPSSYNVPIHGAYNNNGQKPTCTSGICDSSTNYLIHQGLDSTKDIPKTSSSSYSPSGATGAINCAGQNCGILSNPTPIGQSFTTPSLTQVHNGLPTPSVPTLGSSLTGCKTPDCSSYPITEFPSSVTKPNYGTGLSSKFPEHTEGFGGPTVKPNKLLSSVSTGGSSYTHSIAPSFNAPSVGTTASDCTTPDCSGYTPGHGAVHGVNVPSTSFGVTHHGSLHPSTAGADAHFGSFGVTKPVTQKLPAYTGGFGGPTGVLKPNEFNAIPGQPGYTSSGLTSPSTGTPSCNTPNCDGYSNAAAAAAAGAHGQSESLGAVKPNSDASSTHEKLPPYTGGFGGPAGVLAPVHGHGSVTHNPGYSQSGIPSIKPSVSGNTAGCKTSNCAGYPSAGGAESSAGANVVSGTFQLSSPSTGLTPESQKLPSYTGGFGAPAGVIKPNVIGVPVGVSVAQTVAHPASPSYIMPSARGPSTACTSPNCAYPTADAHSGSFGAIKPSTELPAYTGGFGGPSGVYKPNEFSAPTSGSYPTSSGALDCKTTNCAGYPSAGGAESSAGANAVSGTFQLSSPSTGLTPERQKLPSYTGGFGAPAGVIKPNVIGVPIGVSVAQTVAHPASPSYIMPSVSGPSTACTTPNCAYPTTDAHSGSFSATKPSTELPAYIGGFGGPSGVYKPNESSAPSSGSYPTSSGAPDCKTTNCAGSGYPAGVHKPEDINVHGTEPNSPSYSHSGMPSESSGHHTAGVAAESNAQSGTFGVNKPNGSDLTSEKLPVYTGGFGAPAGVLKPHEAGAPTLAAGTPSFDHSGTPLYNAPSTTGTLGCKTPNCGSYPPADAGAVAGAEANAQAGSQGVTKPISDSSSDEKVPPYTGGFGAPSGLLKPNEYTAPAVGVTPAIGVSHAIDSSLSDSHKPTVPTENYKPASCNSGTCAHHVLSPHAVHTGASNVVQATAGASAAAEAVAYTGGFGGPPGYLIPYDGKFGVSGVSGKQTIGAQFESHQSPSGISSHGASGTGSQAVSIAQATSTALAGEVGQAGAGAHASVVAAATSGAISGYSLHGSHSDHSGHGVKGGCGGGCGGSGGSNFGYSGGLGLSKHGYVDGVSGSLSSSGATAKSLSGASAFSHGGSFASSSATAHATAGASVKGGYGRR